MNIFLLQKMSKTLAELKEQYGVGNQAHQIVIERMKALKSRIMKLFGGAKRTFAPCRNMVGGASC
jgi:hypothetical protein